MPEFELVLVLAAVSLVRRPSGRAARVATAGVAVAALASAAPYVRRHKVLFPADAQFEQRPEYQVQDWVRKNLPEARIFVAGSVRLWFDTWHDLAQLGGGSDQGINNALPLAAQWQLLLSDDAEMSVEWLRSMGVEAVVVNGKDSKELYHEFHFPDKFAGKLPVLFDNHQGDVVFGVPRRAQGIGRVVKRARIDAIQPFGRYTDLDSLRNYANTAEDGEAAAVTWMSSDEFLVHAAVDPGESVLVRESWDPAWRATSGGREVPLRRDAMGFMLADPPAGEHRILFRFTLPFENAAGRAIAAAAFAVLVMLTYRGYAQSR